MLGKTNKKKLSLRGIERKKVEWHPVVDIRYSMFKMRDRPIVCKVSSLE